MCLLQDLLDAAMHSIGQAGDFLASTARGETQIPAWIRALTFQFYRSQFITQDQQRFGVPPEAGAGRQFILTLQPQPLLVMT